MALREDFERLPLAGQIGLFGVIGLLILLTYYFMSYKSDQQTIKAREDELDTLRREITKGRDAQRKRMQLEVEIERIEAKINQLKRILPEEVEIQRVFDEVTNRVKDAGLQLNAYTPRPKISSETYSTHPQDIVVRGSYHSLGRFFERLASMNRLVNVENYAIRVADMARRPPLLEIRMLIVTYTYIEPQ